MRGSVCVCVCVRARVCAWVWVCVCVCTCALHTVCTNSYISVFVSAFYPIRPVHTSKHVTSISPQPVFQVFHFTSTRLQIHSYHHLAVRPVDDIYLCNTLHSLAWSAMLCIHLVIKGRCVCKLNCSRTLNYIGTLTK